ncbi:MAG: DUF2125 domain-containing protein [Rhodospirillales bacterium]|nr:DUF2125 domain-containing protein [Rhodospirillales bacterium]MSP79979.1 DUF2125 domain-containing protein [Rhodospirillales bacterium]
MTAPDSPGDQPAFPRSRARRIVLGLGLALGALISLYGAGWYYLAGRFADGVRDFLAAQQGEGVTLAYADIAFGGFPDRLEARLIAPAVTLALARGTWIWRPARVAFSARPWSVARVSVDLSGEHVIAPADASGLPRWKAHARTLAVEARLAGADVADLALRGADIRIDGRGVAEELALGRVRVAWRRAGIRPIDQSPEHLRASQSFEVLAEDIRMPPAARLPLADQIARLVVAGEVKGRLASGNGTDALRRWRDDGGTVELRRIEGRWGALALAGEGTLALDGGLQPVGAFSARIEGFSETLDALRQVGAMSGRDALTAKMVLTALARREGEGRPYLTIPLALQERRLYAGPVALLTVPALPW